MTKAIKFNLLLDKHPVRDLEDLRANFNLDDLLTAYHSQILHRWLEVRGLNNELNQLLTIKSSDNLQIAALLCKIFQTTLSDAEIKTAVYPFIFRQQQEQQLKALTEQKFNKDVVIKNYHAGYEQLRTQMLANASDYPFLKAAVNTLWADYAQLFLVDFNRFFDEFIEKSPLTLFTMLANDNYRQSGLFNYVEKESLFSHIPNPYETMKFPYDDAEAVEYTITEVQSTPLLPPYQSYAGHTDGYWKDLEPKGKKCLILKMEAGNFIRNSGKNGEELNSNVVNEEFLILDGIDYKSNNADHALIYMVI